MHYQGCSGVGTRGNSVPTPIFSVGTRSHTFFALVTLLEDFDFSFQFLRVAPGGA